MSATLSVVGAVFVGGTSARMGSDKATLDFGGAPLGARAVAALRDAGIERVVLIGADEHQVRALGAEAAHDLWPGEGPAGAVLSALHATFLSGGNTVVTLACDLPAVDGAAVRRLLGAVPALDADPAIVIASEDGRAAYPNGVWQTRLLPTLEGRFVEEAKSLRDLIGDTPVIDVDGEGAFLDADDPETLDGFR